MCLCVGGGGAAMDANKEMEGAEDSHTIQNGRSCHESSYTFVGWNKVGLVDHTGWEQSRAAQCCWKCPDCSRTVQKQGFILHERFCNKNPGKRSQ